jgi:hypothetical protein
LIFNEIAVKLGYSISLAGYLGGCFAGEIGIHPYVMVVVLSGYKNGLAPKQGHSPAIEVVDKGILCAGCPNGHWPRPMACLGLGYHVQLVHDRRT